MSDELVILAVTDRYPIGDVEDQVFRTAVNSRPFKVIPCPLDPSKPLSEVPLDVTKSVHGLFLLRHAFRKEDLTRFPSLRCIVRTGVGYDKVEQSCLPDAGVTLHNVPDYGTTEVADHALALALSLRRGIILHHDAQREEHPGWLPLDGRQPGDLIQRAKDKTWAILGLGRIGTAVALRAKAFGYKVIFHDPFVANGLDKALDVQRVAMDDVFSRGDVISLNCELTSTTRHIVNSRTLSLCKPNAVLINVARGEMIDLEALYDALRSGMIAAAGLDVLEREPPVEPAPKLISAYRAQEEWLQGRLIVTPHVAFYSREAVEDMRLKSAETMRDVLFDGIMSNRII